MNELVLLASKILTFVMYSDSVIYATHGGRVEALIPAAIGTGILFRIRPYFFREFRERARG